MTTAFFADRFAVHRGTRTIVYPDNHFATVAEGRREGFRVERCTTGRLPERCRAGFGPINFEAIDELERLGSDIPLGIVVAELAD